MPRPFQLDTIEVASPCPASWADMRGDDRARFCGDCRRHVYDLSGMTRAEAEALVLQKEGPICVRFFRRADGTVLTRDCPIGVAAWSRRTAKRAWAVAGAVAGIVVGWVFGPAAVAVSRGESVRAVQPLGDLLEWLDPKPTCVMGGMAPPPNVPPVGPGGG